MRRPYENQHSPVHSDIPFRRGDPWVAPRPRRDDLPTGEEGDACVALTKINTRLCSLISRCLRAPSGHLDRHRRIPLGDDTDAELPFLVGSPAIGGAVRCERTDIERDREIHLAPDPHDAARNRVAQSPA